MSSVEAVMLRGQCRYYASHFRIMKPGSSRAWMNAAQMVRGFAYGCVEVIHAVSAKPVPLTLSSSLGDE